MAKLILFSGGCNSGKTTTLKAVASRLRELEYDVKILDEIMRKETDKPIDELRKDAKSYLLLQDKIITEKISQERNALADPMPNRVYLADRAVTDSLFYLENYVDKSQLDEDSLKRFIFLHHCITSYLKRNFGNYSLVVEFSPLAVEQLDLFRPANINILKTYESACISRINSYYSDGYRSRNIIFADLNSERLECVINNIIIYAIL